MLTTATTELIHSVLDGEASEAQAQQLQHILAADPAARAEFDAAERLFADFKNVPQRHPPEGLVAAVMAAVEVPAATSHRSNQLFSRPRVLGSGSRDDSVRTSWNTRPRNRFHSFLRSIDMSQQTRSPFGSRKIWIGSAIAVAAVVGVTQFGLDGKTNEKDVIGTIAPAERVRAAQPSAGDIKLGTPTSNETTVASPGPQGAAAEAGGKGTALSGVANAAQSGVANAAQSGVANAAQSGVANAAQAGVANAAQAGVANAAQAAAKGTAQAGVTNAAQAGVANAAQAAAKGTAQAGVANAAQAGVANAAQAAAKGTAQAGVANAAQAGVANAAQAAAKGTAQAGVSDAAQAAAKGTAQSGARTLP